MVRVGAITSIVLMATAACQAPLIDGEGVVAITNATLIDGTGAPPRPNAVVVLEDGRIAQVVDASGVRFGPSVEVIEADGQWILPGFIDTHAHVMGPRPGVTNRLQSLLDYGITAARAPSGVTDLNVEVRDAIESGEMAGPLFRVAGVPLDAPGPRTGIRAIVSSEEEARAEVRRQAAAGVDFIKLYTRLSPEDRKSVV